VYSRLAISAINFPSCTVASLSLQFVFPRAQSLRYLCNSFSIVRAHFAISAIRIPSCTVASQSLQFHLHRAQSLCNICNSLSVVHARFAILFLVSFSFSNFNYALFRLHILIYSYVDSSAFNVYIYTSSFSSPFLSISQSQ
jgi:hypothetical protein